MVLLWLFVALNLNVCYLDMYVKTLFYEAGYVPLSKITLIEHTESKTLVIEQNRFGY